MTAIRHLGIQDYEPIWRDMQQFTVDRTPETEDELWIVEHPPVYTLGLNGKREHLLNTGNIPVIHCDRGGQVTYHGSGQVVIYTLLDLTRLKLNIRQLVSLLEQAMIDVLAAYNIDSKARADAPGVYVGTNKIGSIGIRIKKNCSYHGLSLNNNMDLRPFDHINPCGYADLKVTQLADLGIIIETYELANRVAHALTTALHR
ncbi:lipoyl-protein ligase [Crenothrix polyspora]|uniref:Octanoyltransferase n=1 Tax=Crenothrix polyspora TaxID=360316 RepID=A0A1R4GYA1_9GAMM|nr:lipoyl(octanoyl) transferase LipB [Crenothrix polyspora]SJM89007.1 lipoyl-protein ligase [Crenothrix polyspora]